jgi:hypothetical protein
VSLARESTFFDQLCAHSVANAEGVDLASRLIFLNELSNFLCIGYFAIS